ncbi:hypothetical protein [Actinotalea sp. Marseille-Q4924]|uniref:hypothetical protein n=1 Tax=Actinotalea sp. Marseille-Q4924 TaxID=2866571 RepID=UPI001CE452FF|nr:hypothetical protein [Actinotalea sp. Marseille-Q4924]
MSEQPERTFKAMSWPGAGGNAGDASIAVSAPVGAVSRRDRERAARTALRTEGPSRVVLHAELPGSVLLQHRSDDGGWVTLSTTAAARDGRTAIELPDATSPRSFRVVFSPRNPNISAWVSEPIAG